MNLFITNNASALSSVKNALLGTVYKNGVLQIKTFVKLPRMTLSQRLAQFKIMELNLLGILTIKVMKKTQYLS